MSLRKTNKYKYNLGTEKWKISGDDSSCDVSMVYRWGIISQIVCRENNDTYMNCLWLWGICPETLAQFDSVEYNKRNNNFVIDFDRSVKWDRLPDDKTKIGSS